MLNFRLLIFWITLPTVFSQYYFVTVPNVIHFEHDETVTISVFGLTNTAVKVWCQFGEEIFSEKTVVVQDEEHPVTTTITVTEDDVFDSKTIEKPRTIQIMSECQGQTKSKDVSLSYNTGFLIVQTDKPIYAPDQKVTVTIIALDESKKAETTRAVGFDLTSPSNITLARRILFHGRGGIFKHQFLLPPHPEKGVWSARSFYLGKFETEEQTQFIVGEHERPPFSVTIDVDVPCILPDTVNVRIDVRAKYFHGKPVHGTVSLILLLRDRLDARKLLFESSHNILGRDWGGYSVKTFDINVTEILNSEHLLDTDFPEKSRLEVKATVYDTALTKEVTKTHYGTIFARNPYVFKFSRSKRVYLPGFSYFLKIDVTYVNGEPAVGKTTTINMFKGDELLDSKEETTDSRGRIVTLFPMSPVADTITFFVNTTSFQKSEPFIVVPRAEAMQDQVQVEYIPTYDGKFMMRILTNMAPVKDYTGLFLMVINGDTMKTTYKKAANQINMEISREVLHAPLGNTIRLLAFYVDKNNHEVVADSVQFQTESSCTADMMSLDVDKMRVYPGSVERMLVRGSPFTWVSVHVTDAAVTSMYENHVSMNDMILSVLESHDRGCGQGGGRNSAEVFQTTGLTVLTNAVVNGDALQQSSSGCDFISRAKRETSMFSSNEREMPNYVEYLNSYGFRHYTLSRSDMRETLELGSVQLDRDGERHITFIYPDTVTSWKIQALGITEDQGLCLANPVEVQSFRSFFMQLELPYKAKRLESFEAKVTVYNYGFETDDPYTVNVYLESDVNICYHGNPGTPTSPTQVDLPPNSVQTIRFPVTPVTKGLLPIKVTAVTIHTDIPAVDTFQRKLLVVSEGVEEHVPIQVCLDPNRQLEDCTHDVRVISEAAVHSHVLEQVLTLNLTLPASSIPGSGTATAYMRSSLMNDIVTTTLEGAERLMRQPIGSFETTIAQLANTVYSLYYLEETNQLTSEVETKALSWISNGIERSKQFRHTDRSFSTWSTRASSTWLTAFAAKVGCHLQHNGYRKSHDLFSVLLVKPWFEENIQEDGQFVENMSPVYRENVYGSLEMKGPSFTANVLVALLECSRTLGSMYRNRNSIHPAAAYVEGLPINLLKNSPYTLAVSTYALALYNSFEKWRFKRLLHEIQHKEGEYIFWGSLGEDSVSSEDVETTAYALLAMLELDDLRTSAYIVRWLTDKRKDVKSFKNMQETSICLQALTAYSQRAKNTDADTDLEVSLSGYTYRLTKEKTFHSIRNLPVESGDNTLTIIATGYGYGRMTIDMRYHRPEVDNEICPFELSDVEVIDRMDCNTCDSRTEEDGNSSGDTEDNAHSGTVICNRFSIRSMSGEDFNATVVEFGVESGVEVIEEDLKKLLQHTRNIKQYDIIENGQTSIKFLIEVMTSEKTWISFCLNDTFSEENDVHTRQPSIVHVYDQTNHEHFVGRRCSKLYSTDPDRGLGGNFICDKDTQQCQCFRDLCVTPVDDELKLLAKMGEKPAKKLANYTCNPENANYAVLVEIKDIQYDARLNFMIANAKVNKTIRQGKQPLKRSDMMTFFWKSTCRYPSVKVERLYYIIGKDGVEFTKADNTTAYMYPLMDTALVIEERTTRLLRIYLRVYTALMEKTGCLD
ncbi:complement C5-like [Mercenaria mercenaria]|uniref:complement C5-like n=1 Tax=Mercenaria mercenaria TaxID=6596 RepID=UPI00234E5234|nr:complement C5-like [Mercenaria mercenaria]